MSEDVRFEMPTLRSDNGSGTMNAPPKDLATILPSGYLHESLKLARLR